MIVARRFQRRVGCGDDGAPEGRLKQCPKVSQKLFRSRLELGAKHADHVIGGNDAGQLVVFVHNRKGL